jgi:ribosomal protein L21E
MAVLRRARRRAVLDWRARKRGFDRLRQSAGKFGRGEIRVLNVDGSLDRAIPFDRENREIDLI